MMSLFSSSNQEEINNLRQIIKNLEKRLATANSEIEKLTYESDSSKYEIKHSRGRLCLMRLKHILQFQVYSDQRPLNMNNVEQIKDHQLSYHMETNAFQDNQPFIIAYHPEHKKIFRNKKINDKRTDKILIDGQHRLEAFKKICEERPELLKLRMSVRLIPCNTIGEVYDEFLDLNMAIPLVNSDFDKDKHLFNYSEIIHEFVSEKLREDRIFGEYYNVFSKKEMIRLKKKHYMSQFYAKLMIEEFKEHNDLKKMAKMYSLNSNDLYHYFIRFNKMKIDELREENYNTFKFCRKKQTGQMRKLFRKTKTSYNHQVISYYYYKRWAILVDDLFDYIAGELEYEEESEEESEEDFEDESE